MTHQDIFHDIDVRGIFNELMLVVKETEVKTNKWEDIKPQRFSTVKEMKAKIYIPWN